MGEETESTETIENESEIEYDIETYRSAIEEARRTLDQQLQAFNDITNKAWRIVQLNGIVATIYVSAVVNAADILTFTLPAIILIGTGLILMSGSVLLAAEGQEAKKTTIGQGSDAFESVRKNDPKEIAYLYKTLEDYESWIDEVNSKTERNGSRVNCSKRLLILGVVFITIGTLVTFVP